MKKYLISLARDEARREMFFSQPDTADFRLFDAVNTMEEEWEALGRKYDLARFEARYRRKPTKGELGCTFSHLGVYKSIAEDASISEEEYCLVCEDDALFNHDFQASVEQLIAQESEADIILVGQSKIPDFDDAILEIEFPTPLIGQTVQIGDSPYHYSYPYRNYFAGTVAYLIKKSAARKLCFTEEAPFWLADDFILFERQFGLDILVVRPLMAIENPALMSNLAAARNSLEQKLWKKIVKYPLKKFLAIKRNMI